MSVPVARAVSGPGTGTAALIVRAHRLREAGDYRSAAACLREVVVACESVLGPLAGELVVPLNELGIVAKYLGDFAEADRVYRRALSIHEHHGGTGDANLAAILHNIAGLAHAKGDARAAEPVARRGIAVRSALDRTDPLDLARDYAALAAILVDLGHLGEARNILEKVLITYRAGHHRYEVAVAMHNLGSLQFRAGDYTAALATLRKALTLKRATLGRRHPDLGVTLYNLARCHEETGRVVKARRRLRQAIDILDGAVADHQPTLSACRSRLLTLPARLIR